MVATEAAVRVLAIAFIVIAVACVLAASLPLRAWHARWQQHRAKRFEEWRFDFEVELKYLGWWEWRLYADIVPREDLLWAQRVGKVDGDVAAQNYLEHLLESPTKTGVRPSYKQACRAARRAARAFVKQERVPPVRRSARSKISVRAKV